jgi:hypothetical protein
MDAAERKVAMRSSLPLVRVHAVPNRAGKPMPDMYGLAQGQPL